MTRSDLFDMPLMSSRLPQTTIGRCYAGIHIYSKKLTEKWWFEKIIVGCVILNSVMILVDIQGFSHFYIDPSHNNIDLALLRHIGRDAIFLTIYWFEVLVRVSATGWRVTLCETAHAQKSI